MRPLEAGVLVKGCATIGGLSRWRWWQLLLDCLLLLLLTGVRQIEGLRQCSTTRPIGTQAEDGLHPGFINLSHCDQIRRRRQILDEARFLVNALPNCCDDLRRGLAHACDAEVGLLSVILIILGWHRLIGFLHCGGCHSGLIRG